MSKGFHREGINISFSNEFATSRAIQLDEQHHHQQLGGSDKLRVRPGFEQPPSLVAEEAGAMPLYETGGMWSDMFNFPSGGGASTEFMDNNQISSSSTSNYRMQREAMAPAANEWYGNRAGGMGPLGDSRQPNSDNRDSIAQNHQISRLNADSAAAMQLFLMNPQPTSPSSPPPHPPPPGPSSASSAHLHLQGFHSSSAPGQAFGANPIPPSSQFHWGSSTSATAPPPGGGHKIGGTGVENQGLSLTLSTSLQHLEAAKAEEFRMGDDGVFYYDPSFQMKNLGNHNQAMQGMGHNQHIGLRSSVGTVSLLRNSKYVKAAQELLEEFCSVGRGHLKSNRSLARQNSKLNSNQGTSSTGGNGSSSSTKNPPQLSASDRIDYQRKKTKLLSMLDEVDRRYSHYCEQMQSVVNSYDSIMGFGSATPYTSLAQKAMSRHFRCLKDAITAQLKQTCELLGDKDTAGVTGVTKGETPRLKLLEQSLRQQRAFHQMGMMEQEAWRPQRGLPERSVNILRAWLFEHFLHPYPSDADKHLLARQTGLSRNQVSNWFINARVRLWKPMVEEMYQQEAKDEDDGDEDERESNQTNTSNTAQTSMPTTTQPGSSTTTTTAGKKSHINDIENDPSFNAINTQCYSENQAIQISPTTTTFATLHSDYGVHDPSSCHINNIIGTSYGTTAENAEMASTLVRFGTTMGDVSLTLGLRHAGNLPDKGHVSLRDFGGC